MTQTSFKFITRGREDAEMGVLHAFASSRLRVIPLSRHRREGGGPSPDRTVYTKAPVLDSRLRGNDELWGFAEPKPLPFRGGVGVGLVGGDCSRQTAPTPIPVEPLGSVWGTDPSTPEGESQL